MIWDLLDVHLPIVCALNGHAVGLGASIALLCDVVFMAESATIADPHVRVGIVAGDGGTVAWPLAVGPMLAKRYLLTGDPVPAVEAERLGLVTEVVPDDEVDGRGHGLRPPARRRRAAGRPVHEAGGEQAGEGRAQRRRSTWPPRSRSSRSEATTTPRRSPRCARSGLHDSRDDDWTERSTCTTRC